MTDTQAQEAARLAEMIRAAMPDSYTPQPISDDDARTIVLAQEHLGTANVAAAGVAGVLAFANALLRSQVARIAELEKELQATSDKLQDLQSLFDRVKERRAQISHRLWVWAHEELGEPLKTRYFNIVANGTADVMEHPTYAQQYNGQKYRAEAAEAERDALRAELARMREPLGAEALADKCEAWLQLGGATNVVDAFEAGYRECEAHGITKTGGGV